MASKGGGRGRDRPRIDYKRIAEAALNDAESLLRTWLADGHKAGAEWKSINPTRADRCEGSFSVNMVKGAWGDFATGDKGKDLISLCAYLFYGGDQEAAARELAERYGIQVPPPWQDAQHPQKKVPMPAQPPKDEPAGKKPKQKSWWVPVLPVPDDAPEPLKAHPHRGLPERVWCYRDGEGRVLGYVYRFVTSTGDKEVIPLTWCRMDKSDAQAAGRCEWRWLSFPEPRPLYGLDRLAARPESPVILVEGEKCADVAHAELADYVAVSWPGGGKAVDKVDWSPLAGRTVVDWADCDAQREKLSKEEKEAGADPEAKPLLPEQEQPGVKAMAQIRAHLHVLGCELLSVEIPKPLSKPSGWDIADAVEEGLKGEDLLAYIQERARKWSPEAAESTSTPTEAPAGKEGRKSTWVDRLLRNDKGNFVACLANVYDVLVHSDVWQGVVAFDEFSQRTVKLRPPPYFGGKEGEWEATDDSQTAMWLTRRWHFAPSSTVVAEAIETLARASSFHPVRDYLRTLSPWDGERRLDRWLADYMGVPYTEYSRRVATWFVMGMVARVMKPGCKFDYCLVLEGLQGEGKSTALNILAGDQWFGDTDLDLHNKDSMISLQGKWVYEIAELGAIARSETQRQKSFLSRRVDEFRPPYGRRDIKCPRQLVFAATTNEWEWNKDPTGGRRFWPVKCGGLDLAGLREVREQLLAEALAYYDAGNRYWPSKEEQQKLFDPEQLQREQAESLIDGLHDWVYEQVAPFSMATAMQECLGLDASKWTRDMQTRVGTALRKLGCARIEKRNGMVRFLYKPPEKEVSSAAGQPAQHTSGGVRAPF